jgi:hypothetical protein
MALHIIVDGYNFIRSSRQLNALDRQDLQLGRETLQNMLSAYKKTKGHRITVVFDGQGMLSSQSQRYQVKGVQIIFSRTGRSADDVIKNIAAREREKALIVSSDREVMNFCTSQGATAISSENFEDTVWRAIYDVEAENEKKITAGERKAGTKKRGPSRRLSKKERQLRRKVGKL